MYDADDDDDAMRQRFLIRQTLNNHIGYNHEQATRIPLMFCCCCSGPWAC